jgi:formyltetrahydrofolate deformylase
LYSQNGNILEVDQHVDEEMGLFFMRAAWELDSFSLKKDEIIPNFESEIGLRFGMEFKFFFNFPKPRMAIFEGASNRFYCLGQIHADRVS